MNASQACRTLNIGTGASLEEAKSAYRRLALELHPDRKKPGGDGRRFQEINEAYGILKRELKSRDAGKRRTSEKVRGSGWGAPSRQKSPEEDWSRHTKEFEEENPDFWKEYERKFWSDYERTVNADGRNGEYEKAKEPKAQPNLFVDVDASLCIACQSCETIAPNVFHIDKNANMNPKSKVINMGGAGVNRIMNAAETCPTRAIIVEDRDTKKRMYPL